MFASKAEQRRLEHTLGFKMEDLTIKPQSLEFGAIQAVTIIHNPTGEEVFEDTHRGYKENQRAALLKLARKVKGLKV